MTVSIRKSYWGRLGLTLATGAFLIGTLPLAYAAKSNSNKWASFGGDLENTHHQKKERELNRKNVSKLTLKWKYAASGVISSPPAAINGILYFTDHGGGVHAVDEKTGQAIWSKNTVTDYSSPGAPIDYSRNTPAIKGDYLILGSQGNLFSRMFDVIVPTGIDAQGRPKFKYDINKPNRHSALGAWLLVINRHTGNLVSKIQIDDHPLAIVTQSPIVVGEKVFVGISSHSSVLSGMNPAILLGVPRENVEPYPCCTFYGGAVAIDISDASHPKIDWHYYTVPTEKDAQGHVLPPEQRTPGLYSGASVWGGQMAYSKKNKLLYFGTGNNHSLPSSAVSCFANAKNDPSIDPETCDDSVY